VGIIRKTLTYKNFKIFKVGMPSTFLFDIGELATIKVVG